MSLEEVLEVDLEVELKVLVVKVVEMDVAMEED